MYKINKKVFTLIEIIVVISIISFLATLTVMQVQKARSRQRDVIRINTLAQVQKALEMYASQNQGKYPTSTYKNITPTYVNQWGDGIGWCYFINGAVANWIPSLFPAYIGSVPRDPSGGNEDVCNGYAYRSDGVDYKIINYQTEDFPSIKINYPNMIIHSNIFNADFVSVYSKGGKDW